MTLTRKFLHSLICRVDAVARAWFSLRARTEGTIQLYLGAVALILLGLAMIILPAVMRAPVWLGYPFAFVGVVGVLAGWIVLLLCVDVTATVIPDRLLNWFYTATSLAPNNVSQQTQYRQEAGAYEWKIPMRLGRLEEAFLSFRMRGKINSQLARMQLERTPEAVGSSSSKRL